MKEAFVFTSKYIRVVVVFLLVGCLANYFVPTVTAASVGDLVASGSIQGNNPIGPTVTNLIVGVSYKVVVSGVVDYDSDGIHILVDPQWGGTISSPQCWCQRYAEPKFNGAALTASPGTYTSTHTYNYYWLADTSTLQFSVTDSNYADNTGSWNYSIYITALPSTPTPPPTTKFSFDLLLHGLGNAGDSANPGSAGNFNLIHPQRNLSVEVYDSQNQLILTKDGVISFDNNAGNFKGTVDMGSTLTDGIYTVKVKSSQFLKTLMPGIQTITANTTKQFPQTAMINGDVDNDNAINIIDYNILIGCYSDFTPAPDCDPTRKMISDLNDDGNVNQFDYNLFLRELTNISGK